MPLLKQLNQSNMVRKRSMDTIIGDGLVFTNAAVKGAGVFRIDGDFSGNIDIEGYVVLGETGVINGDVSADNAIIAGQFTGDLIVRNTLHLTETADLEGKIEAGSLIIDEGAAFSATCAIANTKKRKELVLDDPKALKD